MIFRRMNDFFMKKDEKRRKRMKKDEKG